MMPWDLNWEEGTSHASRKLKFGKQTFAGPGRDKRTKRDSLSSRLTKPTPHSLQVSLVIKLILETRALIQILPEAKADVKRNIS